MNLLYKTVSVLALSVLMTASHSFAGGKLEKEEQEKRSLKVKHQPKAIIWSRDVPSLSFGYPGEGTIRPQDNPTLYLPLIKQAIQETPDVQIISMTHREGPVTDAFFREFFLPVLPTLTNLRFLDLSGTFGFKSEDMDLLLARLPRSLEVLILDEARLNKEGFEVVAKHLPNLPFLRYLSLRPGELSNYEEFTQPLADAYFQLPAIRRTQLRIKVRDSKEAVGNEFSSLIRSLSQPTEVQKSKL